MNEYGPGVFMIFMNFWGFGRMLRVGVYLSLSPKGGVLSYG